MNTKHLQETFTDTIRHIGSKKPQVEFSTGYVGFAHCSVSDRKIPWSWSEPSLKKKFGQLICFTTDAVLTAAAPTLLIHLGTLLNLSELELSRWPPPDDPDCRSNPLTRETGCVLPELPVRKEPARSSEESFPLQLLPAPSLLVLRDKHLGPPAVASPLRRINECGWVCVGGEGTARGIKLHKYYIKQKECHAKKVFSSTGGWVDLFILFFLGWASAVPWLVYVHYLSGCWGVRENLSDIIHFVSAALQLEENATGLVDFWAGVNGRECESALVTSSTSTQSPRCRGPRVPSWAAWFCWPPPFFFFQKNLNFDFDFWAKLKQRKWHISSIFFFLFSH